MNLFKKLYITEPTSCGITAAPAAGCISPESSRKAPGLVASHLYRAFDFSVFRASYRMPRTGQNPENSKTIQHPDFMVGKEHLLRSPGSFPGDAERDAALMG